MVTVCNRPGMTSAAPAPDQRGGPRLLPCRGGASGIGRVSHDDRQAVAAPRRLRRVRDDPAVRGWFDSDWDVWVFSLPTNRWRLTTANDGSLSALRLDGRRADRRCVRFPARPRPTMRDLPAEQSDRVSRLTRRPFVLTLRTPASMTSPGCAGGPAIACLSAQSGLLVSAPDPALGLAEIAPSVNISPSYLHKLFEADTTRSRLHQRSSPRPGLGGISWTHGFPCAPSPQSRTPAVSATSAA